MRFANLRFSQNHAIVALALAALLLSPSVRAAGNHHVLKASKQTVQWGWLDPKEPPKLRLASGDTAPIETWTQATDRLQPAITLAKIQRSRHANREGASRTLTRR